MPHKLASFTKRNDSTRLRISSFTTWVSENITYNIVSRKELGSNIYQTIFCLRKRTCTRDNFTSLRSFQRWYSSKLKVCQESFENLINNYLLFRFWIELWIKWGKMGYRSDWVVTISQWDLRNVCNLIDKIEVANLGESIKETNIAPDEYMVSFNVVLLFTCIPLKLAFETIVNLFDNFNLNLPPTATIEMLEHCLPNYLQFGNCYYQQVKVMKLGGSSLKPSWKGCKGCYLLS